MSEPTGPGDPFVPAPAAARAVALLPPVLRALGYQGIYARVAGLSAAWPGPFARDLAGARARARDLNPEAAAAASLLALGDPTPSAALPPALRGPLQALAEAELVRPAGEGAWRTADWVLVPFGEGLLMTDAPRGYSGRPVEVYLGPDSLLLARMLPRRPGQHVLDLGSGCGIQGILAVPEPACSLLVDLVPRAVRFSALNAALNGAAGRTRCVTGDLFAPAAGRRFDLIACVPPYVPVPEGVTFTEVANGGSDGLGFLRRLLPAVGRHLRPGGQLVAICQLLGTASAPLLMAELGDLAPDLAVRIEVLATVAVGPFLDDLVPQMAERLRSLDPAELRRAYGEGMRARGVTHVYTVCLRAGPAPTAGSDRASA